jgi:hypothetical protein
MRKRIVISALATLSSIAWGQTPWQRTEQADPFRGTHYTQFELVGKFLTPPRNPGADAPRLIVLCQAGKTQRVFNGRFLAGYVTTGAVLDSQVIEREGVLSGKSFPTVIPVQYRLDGGKIRKGNWAPSTDHSAAFFSDIYLEDLLYGHMLPHKENTSPPVQKVLIAMNESLASEIIMSFEMPDPTEIADVCGELYRKK